MNRSHREHSVIDIVDSDDEVLVSQDSKDAVVQLDDEGLARRLAKEWAEEEATAPPWDKGKSRASPEQVEGQGDADPDDDDIVMLDNPYSEAPGVNGSCSSKHRLPPIGTSPRSAKASTNGSNKKTPPAPAPDQVTAPVTPPLKQEEELKPIITPSKATGTITTTSADHVEPIDFDTDAFLFRPENIDTSAWPKGRLPYSILVGVYVQVSSTRSRLTIVRVLTK